MKGIIKGIIGMVLAFAGLWIFFHLVGLFVDVMSKLPMWVGVTLFVAEIIFCLKKVR